MKVVLDGEYPGSKILEAFQNATRFIHGWVCDSVKGDAIQTQSGLVISKGVEAYQSIKATRFRWFKPREVYWKKGNLSFTLEPIFEEEMYSKVGVTPLYLSYGNNPEAAGIVFYVYDVTDSNFEKALPTWKVFIKKFYENLHVDVK